jgi:hypothetical protein
MEARVDWFD